MKNCGEITSIGAHHSLPNHVSINVAHGKKKPAKKGLAHYDDRPTSTFVVPKKHAKKYSVGQNVNVHMTPSEGPPEELY